MVQSASDHFRQLADQHRKRAAAVSNPDSARNHKELAAGYDRLATDAQDGITRRPRPAGARTQVA